MSVELLTLMTRGAGPSEDDFLNDKERAQLEREQARNAKQQKKTTAAESSTKPNHMEKSQNGSNVDSAASVSNIQVSPSGTGSSVPPEQEQACNVAGPKPKPKPKPRKKNLTAKKSESNLGGNEMEQSQSHISNNHTIVHKVGVITREPSLSSPMVRDSLRECKLPLHFTVLIFLNSHVLAVFHASYGT